VPLERNEPCPSEASVRVTRCVCVCVRACILAYTVASMFRRRVSTSAINKAMAEGGIFRYGARVYSRPKTLLLAVCAFSASPRSQPPLFASRLHRPLSPETAASRAYPLRRDSPRDVAPTVITSGRLRYRPRCAIAPRSRDDSRLEQVLRPRRFRYLYDNLTGNPSSGFLACRMYESKESSSGSAITLVCFEAIRSSREESNISALRERPSLPVRRSRWRVESSLKRGDLTRLGEEDGNSIIDPLEISSYNGKYIPAWGILYRTHQKRARFPSFHRSKL